MMTFKQFFGLIGFCLLAACSHVNKERHSSYDQSEAYRHSRMVASLNMPNASHAMAISNEWYVTPGPVLGAAKPPSLLPPGSLAEREQQVNKK